ncbi:MAG: MopE-related protein [Sandaracinaceae bacterium]
MIALDTSGSMVRTLDPVALPPWTYGDGSMQNCTYTASGGGHWCGVGCTAGIDQGDADNIPNESRIFIAKEAIRNMVLAYGEVDWALARFAQTTGAGVNCDPSYHDPWCETFRGDPVPCLNYLGSPGFGTTCTTANILVGFPDRGAFIGRDNTYAILSWIDHRETAFNASTTSGNFCNTASGTTDCEIRANGQTPLAALITQTGGYMAPIRAADPRSCRNYAIILIADGGESCGGNPPSAAAAQLSAGIRTHVVGLGTDSTLRAALNAVATAGGTDAGAPGGDTAYFVTNQAELSAGLAQIVSDSLVFEVCNGADDDCDGRIDEGVANACGGCGPAPAEVCNGADEDCDGTVDEGATNACGMCGPPPAEVCNRSDDDCDGRIDEDGMGGDICAGCSPTAEACDGRDNDCDGTIDEGVTRACGSSVGECMQGVETCIVGSSGMFGSCVGAVGPTPETCNGDDDDCDGSIDGFSVPCDSTGHMGRGICQLGSRLCIAGSFGACVGEILPRTELCNGLDDDCDGSMDEGDPGGGAACGSSVPPCSPGTLHCMGGMLVCSGGVSGSPETCNNADDDCDAVIDEGNPGGGAMCGPMTDVGRCDFGVLTCVPGMGIQCLGATYPAMEVCDTADNDCDGSIDEMNPGGGAACGSAVPPCMQGVLTCNPLTGALDCVGEVMGSAETCDAMDNDCDTRVDEGIPVGTACGSSIGECRTGVNVCNPATGGFDCQGEIGPEPETCDSLDNDCDTMVDEGLGLGGPCGSSEGLCMPGTERCVGGRLVCEGEVGPGRETCDCDDNDCDGSTDEMPATGTLCPPGSSCVDCQCALPCANGEFGFTCPEGKTPRVEGGMCFCVAERCNADACATQTIERDTETLCAPDSADVANCVCRNNECTFSCDGVVCGMGTVCDPRDPLGRCVVNDCTGLGCDAGELCDVNTGECVTDPCESITCDAGESCRDGVCEASCAGIECGPSERCHAGTCFADLCATVSCPAHQVCDPATGDCTDDLCESIHCPSGRVCDVASGNCVTDPCNTLRCPGEQICEGGECTNPPVPGVDAGPPGIDAGTGDGRDRVLASGGCNCRVGAAPSRPSRAPWAILGLALAAGLAVRRRSRRRRGGARRGGPLRPFARSVLASLWLLGGGGCDVDPFCLDCVDDGGVADAGFDAGFDAGGPRDAGPPDGSADGGVDGSTDEVCNGIDDDGDGDIDEDFDLETNLDHCGACDTPCAPLGAFGACVGGMCTIDSCDVGRIDLDGDPSNGCEYRCLVEETDDAICDRRDNDCDGMIDEDIDLTTDPLNCGMCGLSCQFSHAAATCVAGVCTLGACDTDFHDLDMNPANGCEVACTPASPPIELCNRNDDDCDGMIDEGDPEGGGSCGTNVGVCTFGVEHCVGGALACMGGVRPGTEVCGPAGSPADEDCDSNVDEGHPPRACGSSVGICQQGNEQCIGGSVVCVGETPPAAAETCNGLDDNCNGMIDEGNPGGGAACGSTVGACRAGMLTCTSPSLTCVGATGPSLDLCDGVDNDCDMGVDEGFDLMNDATNCGMCGRTCSFAHGFAACMMGSCQLVGCAPGYVDDDGNPTNGCEYACSYTGAEICDGRDNDCNTSTTEAALPPPPNFCNPNGVCAGTTPVCTGTGGWVCNYTHAAYQATETLCDIYDNDCDGAVNEGYPTLGQACGNGAGACRVSGTIRCNTAMNGTECSAGMPLPPAMNESCNGIDDDCDTRIDEAIPLANLPSVRFTGSGGSAVRIMSYEASRPDATATSEGIIETRACSHPNATPWTNVTWTEARNACCALNPSGTCATTGWRLCDAADWQIACQAGASCTWSYMSSCSTSSQLTCNGEEYDSTPATPTVDDDALFPTGSTAFGACFSDWGAGGVVYDLSGNAREWTNTQTISSSVHQIRGGSYDTIEPGRTCQFNFTSGNNSFAVPNTGFRCCFYCKTPGQTCAENAECCSSSCIAGHCT